MLDRTTTKGRDWLARFRRCPPWEAVVRLERAASVYLEQRDATDQQHLRMFTLSHLFGPFIGLALGFFLLLLGFPADARLAGFTALVCLFWAYPAALVLGAPYPLLSLISLQHLILVILWASHGYGGLTSPFLLWLAIVPLLAFLYSAPRLNLWLIMLAMLGLNIGVFAAIAHFILAPPPTAPEALRWIAIVSFLSASAYVSMMAVYFGQVLSSRNEMALEAAHRSGIVRALDDRATELRHMRARKIASLSRLARQCREPVDDILVNCRSELEHATGDRAASNASDLGSIRSAATRLRGLIEAVDNYAMRTTAGPAPPQAP